MSGIGTINFGGLASGLDTQTIIDGLMKVESQPLTRLQTYQTQITDQSAVFAEMKTDLNDLKDVVYNLKSSSTFNAFSASSSDEEALNTSVSSSASAGNHTVRILRLAQAEIRSSASYESSDGNLGLSGEISVNGKSVKVKTSDSLIDIRNAINTLKDGVQANILKVGENDYRLMLSAGTQGAKGFTLANAGSGDILGQFGFTDGSKGVRLVTGGNVVSAQFASSEGTIASQIGITGVAKGSMLIKGEAISIDLGADTLASVRDKINNLGITGVTAAIQPVTESTQVSYRLAIAGTTDFHDDGNVLETMGILSGGTSGVKAEFQFGPLTDKSSGKAADTSSSLTRLGGKEGETILIIGTDAVGNSVKSSFTIHQISKTQDLLDSIASAFGGDVTTEVNNGKITVRSALSGETPISISLTAANEKGGTLDFGAGIETAQGRSRLVADGADALVQVDNVQVTRNTNSINDVLTGVTLDLKKADKDTTLTVTVTQDTKSIKDNIQKLVDTYNKLIKFVNDKSTYNSETNVTGPLLGDMTAQTVISEIQNDLQTSVNNPDSNYSMLGQIGIELNIDGTLSINSANLDLALNTSADSVISIFSAKRTATDNDISFVYSSGKTAPGSYSVSITRAAEMATITSQVMKSATGASGTLSITDDLNAKLEVGYTGDMTAQDIAAAINEQARIPRAKNLSSDTPLLEKDSSSPVSLTTNLSDIAGLSLNENDTILISGKTRAGRSFESTLRQAEINSYTIQNILNKIVSLNNNNVTAAIDDRGSIIVQDKDTGVSAIELSISTNVASSLNFGKFVTTQEGQKRVNVNASVTGDKFLQISQTSYGSAKTFTLSGGQALGFTDGNYKGVDIAGTINNIAGTGSGNSLTASSSDTAARGIIVSSSITSEELASEGAQQGTITLIAGVGERLYNDLTLMTQSVNGFIQTRIDSLTVESASTKTRIDDMNQRLEQKRESYVKRFTELEKAMSQLQSLQQQLSSTLSALPKSY